ncbi:unnamed protein product, partial [Timema podura]|nr:unnamed protein product [Timema podura]
FFSSQGNTNTLEAKLANLQYEFILLQLVELTSVFDLGDEMGRSCLRNLILGEDGILISDKVNGKLIGSLVEILVTVIPNVSTRLQDLAEVISEIHQPLVDVEVSNQKVLSEAQMERNLEVTRD